ncbi:hypothetical protein AVEN_79794-1 [Araneus ventricosus]|uniref:Uncharacterized protein n=1 Tax=Araneus ventricosus TaxID=182803 RepID=A0A4Y2G4A9_ARAVE|nr:hypothetical protein AVEN_79794-1 [Araneus ventricosus]
MSVFAGARKCDLKILAEELGETVNDSHKLKDLKKIILASKEYDEESAKEWMNTIINESKEREELILLFYYCSIISNTRGRIFDPYLLPLNTLNNSSNYFTLPKCIYRN